MNGVKRILRPLPSVTKTNAQKKAIARVPPPGLRCGNPKCWRKIDVKCAQQNDHSGYCRKKCMPGFRKNKSGTIRNIEKAWTPAQRRTARQLRRQVKIQAPEKIGFYDSREWRELRFRVLRKYAFQCMACGRSPPEVKIHVDHIKPRSKYPKLELDFDNLQLLCADCNIGKNNYSEEDLRPK